MREVGCDACALCAVALADLAASLQSDEHDDIGLSLLGLEGRAAAVEQVVQLLDDRRLNVLAAVGARREIGQSRRLADIVLQLLHQQHVHVALQQRETDGLHLTAQQQHIAATGRAAAEGAGSSISGLAQGSERAVLPSISCGGGARRREVRRLHA